MAFKSVKQKLNDWLPNNQPVSSFNGTDADFQQYRQQWVNNCAAKNSSGLLQSKKNAVGLCQAAFDSATQEMQFQNFAQNKNELDTAKTITQGLTEKVAVAFVLIAVISVIIWLLTSK